MQKLLLVLREKEEAIVGIGCNDLRQNHRTVERDDVTEQHTVHTMQHKRRSREGAESGVRHTECMKCMEGEQKKARSCKKVIITD